MNPFPRLLRSGETQSPLAVRVAEALGRPKRLLFVEDDDLLREFFETVIRGRYVVELVSVSTTGDARAKFEGESFDAALLDVRVTNGDGVSLYRWISDRFPEVEVVFLTGYAGTDLRERIEQIGPARIFTKDRVHDLNFVDKLFALFGVQRRADSY